MNLSERSICTLSTRIHQVRRLRASLLAQSRDGFGMRLSFGSEAVDDVRQFVADEARCCPFFEFRIEEIGDRVDLTVDAPPEAADRLASLAEMFDPDTSPQWEAVLSDGRR